MILLVYFVLFNYLLFKIFIVNSFFYFHLIYYFFIFCYCNLILLCLTNFLLICQFVIVHTFHHSKFTFFITLIFHCQQTNLLLRFLLVVQLLQQFEVVVGGHEVVQCRFNRFYLLLHHLHDTAPLLRRFCNDITTVAVNVSFVF